MLVHHFGSKERLLGEALALIRTRRIALLAPAAAMPVAAFDRVFRASWDALASAEFRRYFLLNQELIALALREPGRFRSFLGATTEEWRTGLAGTLVARGFAADEAAAASTLYMAVLRGLLLDLAVTQDRERVDRALELVAARLKDDLERHAATRA